MWIDIIITTGCTAALFILVYVASIFPGKNLRERLKALKGWNYAHRGLHDASEGIFENTLPAFKRAVENGYGAELDVQLTSDKIPVVIHDFDLNRICGVDKKVSELTYEEISGYRVMGGEAAIPRFEDVIRIFEGKAPLIVEVKLAGKNTEICSWIDALLSGSKLEYCIESFNPRVVYWYRKNRPGVIRGQLSSDFLKEKSKGSFWLKFIMKNLMTNFLTKPDFVAYNHLFSNSFALRIYRKLFNGFTVAWTTETPKEHAKAEQHFDLIIFENYLPESRKQI